MLRARILAQLVAAVGLLIASGLLSALPRESRAASLIGLGDFPGGFFHSRAFGVSDDGSVVVGRGSSNAGNEAFRWTEAGGMVALPPLTTGSFPGFLEAYEVSADGSAAVGVSRALTGEAVLWTQSGGTVGLGDFPGGGNPAFNSLASGISADGSVVVGFGTSATGTEAFRWTQAGGMVGLGDLAGGGFGSGASAVSADGSIVVGTGTSGGATVASSRQEAFRWTQAGGMVGLGDLAGGNFSSRAFDVSADGSAVVGTSRSNLGDDAFLWTQAGGMIRIAIDAEAHGVSGDGSVVVGNLGFADAFYWTPGGGVQLLLDVLIAQGADVTGWSSLDWAYDITPDGLTIVGFGTHNGSPEAFLARLDSVPEPSAIWLILVGAIGIQGAVRRVRKA
jgi:probable HAF family extracellular repeat protein